MKIAYWLALILALALALRLGAVARVADRPLEGDATSYDQIAWNLCTGHGYTLGNEASGWQPTATRGPSYVLFLAACYSVAGHRIVVPLAIQAGLDVVACWLVFLLATRWFRRSEVGLIAAALYALYPALVKQSAEVLTESVTCLAVLVTVTAFFAWLDSRRLRSLVVAGIALAVCALAKPQLAPVVAVLALAAVPDFGWRVAGIAFAVTTGIVLVCMAPWMVRNAGVFHAFVPGLTQGGISFWGGTAPCAGRLVGGLSDAWVPDSLRRSLAALNELDQSNRLMRDGVHVIASDPGRYLRLTVRKFLQLWLSIGYESRPTLRNLAHGAVHLVVFALAAFGARFAAPDSVAARAVAALGVFWTVAYLPFCTVDRYAMTYFPLLFCFTAAGLFHLAIEWREWHPAGPSLR